MIVSRCSPSPRSSNARAHQHQARQLALRAGGGLQRHGGQARHLGEDLLQLPHQLERALRALVLLVRVQRREAGERGDALVDPRVVLHRAGAERVEAGVDAEVAVGEVREVADDLVLGQLGQPRRLLARERGRHLGHGQAVVREATGAAARLALLVDELHSASTPPPAPRRGGRRRPACASRSARREARRPCLRSRARARSRDGRRAPAPRGSPRGPAAASGTRPP